MLEREGILIITGASKEPKGILMDIEDMSVSALLEIAEHQLQGNEQKEIFLYDYLGKAKPMDKDALEYARNLFRAGRDPIGLIKGMVKEMKAHSKMAIVDPSIFTSS